ncbi:MAG: hypothetical protein K5666_02030 [Bacilli bacterium]|nr:hypothetical protein [Bacilli bacterium]
MEKTQRKKVGFFLIITAVVMLTCAGILYVTMVGKKADTKTNTSDNKKYLSYKMKGNSLEDFDLYFLQLENEKINKLYSPLSIKYALEMLAEGTNGETKTQLAELLGSYSAKAYPNNKNMSFANAIFIKDSYKDSVKEDYIKNLKQKFNASVFYDSFKTPEQINSFVKKNTFDLIDNLLDDVSSNDFVLINALAIDMEWVNKIKPEEDDYEVEYPHESYFAYVQNLKYNGYDQFDFKGMDKQVAALDFDLSVNKYDIIKVLGEDNIKKTIAKAYEEAKADPDSGLCGDEGTTEQVVNRFVKELKTNYKSFDKSTNFEFYVDDDVKVFAKDLKTYDGVTLQYVGIMPETKELDEFIKDTKAEDLNKIITNLKETKYDTFKEGVITNIKGSVPVFKFEYELQLLNDLKKLGISDAFDQNKADLSNLTSSKAYIDDAVHKANIEFSNDGIKAAAATSMGGKGGDSCGFEYFFDVPVETIDLTFNKPYMFMVRDKDSGEIWFMGTVYEPIDADSIEYGEFE